MRRAKHNLVHPDMFPVESFPAKMNLRVELARPDLADKLTGMFLETGRSELA